MFSVASLLNPVRPEPRGPGTRLPSSPSLSFYASSSPNDSTPFPEISSTKKTKMSKDGAVFAKGKIKGDINYPPFEDLDEEMRHEVNKFHVYPLGKIELYCRHIPYNSEKKSFLEKTGRESFEVFQYIFKAPGDDKDYTVMWDYNIGLVRITPFFKCCKYSKTTPAKMLNMNPGLKDITHSITGGALAAQGYWMPYACALQVCATFCSHIAPALIPIFGPSFPSLCIPPDSANHGRMIIDSSTILSATADAEAYRMQYQQHPPSSSPSSHQSPSHQQCNPPQTRATSMRSSNTPPSLSRSLRLKRTFAGGESSYTDTDGSSDSGYFCSPATPTSAVSLSAPGGWRPSNHNYEHNMLSHATNSGINISPYNNDTGYGNHVNRGNSGSHRKGGHEQPNPLLSAIPRSIDMDMSSLPTTTTSKSSSSPISSSSVLGRLPIPFSCSNSARNYTRNTNSPPAFPSPFPNNTKSITTSTTSHKLPSKWRVAKRRLAEDIDAECEDDLDYDGGEESSASVADEGMSVDGGDIASNSFGFTGRIGGNGGHVISSPSPPSLSSPFAYGDGDGSGGGGASEKKAAWLLMNLSVKDGEFGASVSANGSVNGSVCGRSGEEGGWDGPRVKRRRALSM